MLKNIPDQNQPIFDFYIDVDGKIQKNIHVKYIVQHYTTGMGRAFRYLIHKETSITTKLPDQLNRYLNGHFFTFENDENRARSAMIGYYQNKMHLAATTVQTCQEMLEKLTTKEDDKNADN